MAGAKHGHVKARLYALANNKLEIYKHMKVLFISHEATRTGAPMIFLRLILWLKDHRGIDPVILLQRGGDLAAKFEQAGEVIFRQPDKGRGLLKRGINKLVPIPEYQVKKLKKRLSGGEFDLVYVNSIASSNVLHALLPGLHIPLILHVHELSAVIRMDQDFALIKDHITRFIAVSQAVKSCLTGEERIPEAKVQVIYECIDLKKLDNPEITSPGSLKKKIAKRFVVGGSGTVHWRKGPEFFILVAHELQRRGFADKIKFVWVGKLSGQESVIIDEDLKKTGLKEMVLFTGELEDPYPVYRMFDVFLLTSREDPFPLVALESAWYHTPVICFDKGNGTAEFVKQGAGYVTPYMDIPAMADKLEELFNNRSTAKHLGEKAHHLVKAYDIENIGPMVYKVIEELL